jgi:hypothetical protein
MIPGAVENPYGFNAHDFVPAGKVILSSEVLKEARQFLLELQKYERAAKWIVAFTWCYNRSIKKTPDSPAIDEGSGIDLAGYRSSEIPSEAVEVRDGVPLAFIIPRDQFSLASKKEIIQTKLASGRLSFQLR